MTHPNKLSSFPRKNTKGKHNVGVKPSGLTYDKILNALKLEYLEKEG